MPFQAPGTIFASSMTVFCWISRGLKGQGCPAPQADVLSLKHIPTVEQRRHWRQRRLPEEQLRSQGLLFCLSSLRAASVQAAIQFQLLRAAFITSVTRATSGACTEGLLQLGRCRDLVPTLGCSSEPLCQFWFIEPSP